MTAFSGTLTVQIDADTQDEAQRTLDGIAKRSSDHPCVERVLADPVSKSTIHAPREERIHA